MKHVSRERRRAAILRAARKAYSSRGFLGTRTKDLAAACRISEGALFQYFSSKRHLEKAVLRELLGESPSVQWSDLSDVPAAQALGELSSHFLKPICLDPHLMRLVLFGALEGRAEAGVLFRNYVSACVRELASLFRLWARRGCIDCSFNERELACIYISTLLQSAIAKKVFGSDNFEIGSRKLAGTFVELLMGGSKRGRRGVARSFRELQLKAVIAQ